MFMTSPFVIKRLFLIIDDVLGISNPGAVSAFGIVSVVILPSTSGVAVGIGAVPVHLEFEALITSRSDLRTGIDGTVKAPERSSEGESVPGSGR